MSTTPKTPELMPCPLPACAAPASSYTDEDLNGWIECSACGLRLPNNDGRGPEAWNRRAPAPEEGQRLAKRQPCGCVVCTCEDEERCSGCGAKSCGTHPLGKIPSPVFVPSPEEGGATPGLLEALALVEGPKRQGGEWKPRDEFDRGQEYVLRVAAYPLYNELVRRRARAPEGEGAPVAISKMEIPGDANIAERATLKMAMDAVASRNFLAVNEKRCMDVMAAEILRLRARPASPGAEERLREALEEAGEALVVAREFIRNKLGLTNPARERVLANIKAILYDPATPTPSQQGAEITEAHLNILRHTLGAESRSPGFRNHFITGKNGEDGSLCEDMVRAGHMWSKPYTMNTYGETFYAATESGAKLVGVTLPAPEAGTKGDEA